VSLEYAEKARAASIIWGRDYKTAGHYAVNAITTEGVLPIARKDYVTGRFEWSQRDELFADQPQLASTLPRWFDISAYTVGYTRQVGRWHGTGIGIGANATAYAIQDGHDDTSARVAVSNIYGDHPWGVSVYTRICLIPKSNSALMH
jgi:hypothetical protein